MATGIINNGDYSEEDDGNGNLVLKDPNGNIIRKWDPSLNGGSGGWEFNSNSIEGLSSASASEVNKVKYPTTATEIETAFSEINADGGGHIVLPKTDGGKLDVSGLSLPLDITTDNVVIEGYGEGATIIDASGQANTLFRLNSTTYQSVYFRDFRADAGGGPAFELVDWHGVMQNVHTRSGQNEGIILRGCFSATLRDVVSSGHATNLLIEDGPNDATNNNLSILESEFSVNSSGDMVICRTDGTGNRATDVRFRNCLFNEADQRALRLEGIVNPIVSSCRFERFDSSDSDFIPAIKTAQNGASDDVEGGVIRDNTFAGSGSVNAAYSIRVDSGSPQARGGTGVKIKDNTHIDIDDAAVITGSNSEATDISGGTLKNVSQYVSRDTGTRTIVNGRGFNSGDPSAGDGQWATRFEPDAIIEDTSAGTLYRYATNADRWVQIG